LNHIPLTLSDMVVIGGYLIVVLCVGLYFRKRMHGAGDYFAAGHQVPWWLAGISHYMSGASALTFVGYAQTAYTYGWVAVSLAWTGIPASILGGLFFARRWRRARVVTPVEFLERRFNIYVRQLFAWAGIPMHMIEDGLKLFATALFLSVGFNIPVTWAVVVCGIITVGYTFFGGLWALMVTDYVQFVMKVLAICLLLPLAVWRAGGIHHAFESLPPSFFHATGGQYNWLYLIGFGTMLSITLNGSWALAQKYYSVRDDREASKAAYLATGLRLIGGPMMIVPAILGRKFLPDLIAQHRTGDVYVLLVINLMPAGLVGIVVAALLSATMATVSSDFSSIASVITKDVYQRLFRPDLTSQQLVTAGRVVTLFVGGASTLAGLYLSLGGDRAFLDLMVVIASAFLAPSFLPLMGALVSRRLNSQGIVLGYVLGLSTGLSLLAIRNWAPGFWPWLHANYSGGAILINTGVTIAGMIVGSLLSRTSAVEAKKAEVFFAMEHTPVRAVENADNTESAIMRQRIVAYTTGAVGVLLAVAGLLATSTGARITDLSVAFILIALAWQRLRSHPATRAHLTPSDEPEAVPPKL
jgi:SSS family solute:Na+ symporter